MELTTDQFKQALPSKLSIRVDKKMVDTINKICADPQLRENYRENLISYTSVMADGRFKLPDYLAAVMYVSYKLLGSTNQESYCKTFPGRFQRLVNEGATDKVISSYSTAYFKTKLVQLVLEQTLTPTHVLNADIYQKAINVQSSIMLDISVSAKVRSDAANSIMTQLKPPEAAKIELAVTVKEDQTLLDLKATVRALAKGMGERILDGTMTAESAAHSALLHKQTDDSVISQQ